MTRKQLEIIDQMKDMVNRGLATEYSNSDKTVTVYRSQINDIKAVLVITPEDFRMYANEGIRQLIYNGRLIKLSKRAYPTFDFALTEIQDFFYREQRRKEYEEERKRKIEAKRNHPDTIKNELYNDLIIKHYDDPAKFNRGEWTVLYSYNECRNQGFPTLILDDLHLYQEQDYIDFDEILQRGHITEFVISETSTALMSYLDNLDQYGWKMSGLERINYQEEGWRGMENKEIVGIKLQKVA